MTTANRRDFLRHSGQGVAAAAALAAWETARADEESAAVAANDQIAVALVGAGGMGSGHLQLLASNPLLRVAYVCDADEQRLAEAQNKAESLSGSRPTAVTDMREVFADEAVDAVWIATPDHWHAPAAILALDAKKHVYVEKPCAHNLREARLIAQAAARNGRVCQVGTQSRSTPHVMAAIERLRSGVIGEVLVAKAWNSQRRGSIGHAEPSEPPSHLHFDLWLGPTPERAYQANLLHGIWRWWYDYGTGDMGNDGVHDIDLARWGLGVEGHPTRIAALGGKYFFDDDQQFPDTQTVLFEYAQASASGRPKQLIFEMRIWSPYVQEGYENGDAFYGTEGLLLLGKSGGYRVYGPRNKLLEEVAGSAPDLAAHHRNFLEALAQGTAAHAAIDVHLPSSALCHLGNIATRVGRVLNFDPQTESILDDDAAHALLGRPYRAGHWAAPVSA